MTPDPATPQDPHHDPDSAPMFPMGWFRLSPGAVQRFDGLKVTTPDALLWPLELLGECPFVAEVTTFSEVGRIRLQRPLVAQSLDAAINEAHARFPVAEWLFVRSLTPPGALTTTAPDYGWNIIPTEHPDIGMYPGGEVMMIGGEAWNPDAVERERNRVRAFRAMRRR